MHGPPSPQGEGFSKCILQNEYSHGIIQAVNSFRGQETVEKLKKSVCIQEWGKDILADVLGALLYGAGVYVFAVNANFAPGGITGLAILVNHFFPFLPIGTLTVIINIPVILLCYAYLGKKYLVKSIISMGIIAFVLDVIYPHVPAYTGDPLLAALFAGVISGVGLALIYARGYCTGGSDFIIMAIRKKFPHLSVGSITLIIDGCIILAGGFVFGRVDAVLQGIVMTGASTVMIDKILYGTGSGKRITIITDKGQEVADAIGTQLHRGVSMMKVIGAYSGMEHTMLLCACSNSEGYRVKKLVYSIDPKALIMISPNDEVFGEGFKSPED